MNELIERLAEQCYEHDQSWTGVGQHIFNKEKFARLIAAECAKAIREDAKKFPAGDVTWISAMEESAKVVMKHFGVE